MIRMEKISFERKPNLQMGYENGLKWCGFCGEPREPNKRNRCEICHRQLRGRKRN